VVFGEDSESADLNNSGFVDTNDLILFHEQWHTDGVPPLEVDPAEVVQSTIQGVSIPVDNKPIVTFSLTDGNGNPLLPSKMYRIRFIMGRIVEDNLPAKRTHYECLTIYNGAPSYDRGGSYTDLGGGVYNYNFGTAIPNGKTVAGNLTHTVAIQIAYDPDADLQRSVTNPIYNFRPDGQAVTTVRELSMTEVCNKCHNPLAFHGGTRREFGICILCHTSQLNDFEDENYNMAHMVHQIHLNGNFTRANNAVTPATATNGINSVTAYVNIHATYPQDIRNCNTCHTGSAAHPEQASYNFDVPSRQACGGCHDKVNFETGEGHWTGFPVTNDNACLGCHNPDFQTVAPPTKALHTVPRLAPNIPSITAEIVSVDNVIPGATPTITFKLFQEVGGIITAISPSNLNRCAVTMAGPTVDYAFDRTETITNANSTLNPDGSRTYLLHQKIGDVTSTTGQTYAFGMEARGVAVTAQVGAVNLGETVSPAALNPVVFKAVGGKADPTPRRDVVDWDKCLNCHTFISLHGANRNQYQYCVLCHRPGRDDEARRTAATQPPESIDFKYMIHAIHTGEELDKDYTVYGFGNAAHNYNEVTFPGDRRDCDSCHIPGAYTVPAPQGALPTVVVQDNPPIAEPIINLQPTSAACLSCHDSDDAAEHAGSFIDLNGGVENCAECHGVQEPWSFEKLHFRGL
jgi:OmcA/MtrC family decaheme c-type cytochrome